MCEKSRDGIAPGARDVGAFEAIDDVGGSELGEQAFDDPVKLGSMLDAQRIGCESRVMRQPGPSEHPFTEASPLAAVLDREIDFLTVRTEKQFVRRDRRMRGAAARRFGSAVSGVVRR